MMGPWRPGQGLEDTSLGPKGLIRRLGTNGKLGEGSLSGRRSVKLHHSFGRCMQLPSSCVRGSDLIAHKVCPDHFPVLG